MHIALGKYESRLALPQDEDDTTLAEMMRQQIALRHPRPLNLEKLDEISLYLAAQLRDAQALRRYVLTNGDEPAFATALPGVDQ